LSFRFLIDRIIFIDPLFETPDPFAHPFHERGQAAASEKDKDDHQQNDHFGQLFILVSFGSLHCIPPAFVDRLWVDCHWFLPVL
jgi:hypothetical protein